MPLPLYKYVAADRIPDLLAGRIRFTQPGAFNDPFEMPAFKLRQVEQMSAEQIYSSVLSQTWDILTQAMANPAAPPPTAFELPMSHWSTSVEEPEVRDPETAKTTIMQKLKLIDEKFGILALAGAEDNLLMWAHYADEHKGAVIEIDVDDQDFTGAVFQEARPVNYTSKRPKLPFD